MKVGREMKFYMGETREELQLKVRLSNLVSFVILKVSDQDGVTWATLLWTFEY